jgi:hypothetical protein
LVLAPQVCLDSFGGTLPSMTALGSLQGLAVASELRAQVKTSTSLRVRTHAGTVLVIRHRMNGFHGERPYLSA